MACKLNSQPMRFANENVCDEMLVRLRNQVLLIKRTPTMNLRPEPENLDETRAEKQKHSSLNKNIR